MRRDMGRILAGLATCAVLLTGCASSVALKVPRVEGELACIAPPATRDLVVGVAVSGGGTRAALYGASGFEALARVRTPDGASLLERVDYISSVSGGSVASGYFVAKKPPREVPVLGPDGALTADYRAFFDQYKTALTQDFESALIWRQLGSFRWLNPALAARSLAEIFSERLYGNLTWAQMREREARGDVPRLIVNTTLYNNGRRLEISTLPAEAFHYDFFEDLEKSLASRGRSLEATPYIRERWTSLIPVTPLDLKVDQCRLGLAGAVAGSASFPPLVGPITFQVGDEELYWHTGDGGLYENQGIESLLFVFLKQIQQGTAKRVLIIAFDSSYPFAVGNRQLSSRAQPFTLWSYDFSRIPSIMEERASAYQALFFRSLQIEGVFPDMNTIKLILLKHTDAKWNADLSDLPAACRNANPPLTTPTEVVERIAQIPTRFWLGSECDRQLLTTAADKVVAAKQAEILEFLRGR